MFMPTKFLLCSLIPLNIAASCAQEYLAESAAHIAQLQHGLLAISNHVHNHRAHNLKYSGSPEFEEVINDAANAYFSSKLIEHSIDAAIHTTTQTKVQKIDDRTFRSLPNQVQLLNNQYFGYDTKLKSSQEALAKARTALQKTVTYRKQDPQPYDAACTIFNWCRDHHDIQTSRYNALEAQRKQLLAYAIDALERKKQS